MVTDVVLALGVRVQNVAGAWDGLLPALRERGGAPMTAPAENRYVFDDVDQDADTTPGRYPVTLFPPAPKSLSALAPPKPIRVDQAVASLWTWAELWELLTLVALVSSAGVVGFDIEHFWQLGGWFGVWIALWQNGSAFLMGASLVWVLKRRR